MRVTHRQLVSIVVLAAGSVVAVTPVIASGAASAAPGDTPTTTPTVSATPTGSATPSTTPTTAVVNPTITAQLTSANPESNGWYNNPVLVTFTCTAGSAPLSAPCPDPVSLASAGAAQSPTQTISGTDGGTSSVTVTENIDLGAPDMRAIHPRAGTCRAYDPLSGVASCVVQKQRLTRHGVTRVRWTAIATDKAGNAVKRFGTYRV